MRKILMKRIYSGSAFSALLFFTVAMLLSACSSDDVTIGDVVISQDELTKTIDWNETEGSVSFTASAPWKASVSDVTSRVTNTSISWMKLTQPSGESGDVKMPFLLTENNSEYYRDAIITIQCGEGQAVNVKVHQNANPDAVHIMDASTIKDYNKYYLPAATNQGFEKGADNMLRSDAQWSWWRCKQSDHFFVFWEPGFGDNPNADSVPQKLRVDIDDLLAKAEKFYSTNISTLKMADVGQGKSYLDKYKMEIYLLYQDEWLATGSGYDNVIGALWVNPSTCQPVGSTIGHEIGHSFQYQVYSDKLLNGATDDSHQGFRYGYGEDGAGGNAFWEQSAQWQSFQDYPDQAFGYDVSVWLANHHRHFDHEFMRYASYWLPYYWTQKHGIEAFGNIWKKSAYPNDPLQTYEILYCNNDLDKLYDDLYDYSARCVTYDFDAIHQYATDEAMAYNTTMYNVNGYFQPAYSNCPGTTGFNVIPLNVPSAGTKVSATLEAITPGSSLAAKDPGTMVDADGKEVGTTKTYNTQTNTRSDYRFGYVAVVNGNAKYSEMFHGNNLTASYKVPTGTDKLYLVVVATPDTYNRHAWNDKESEDEQWPYRVKFENTNLKGYVDIDPTSKPTDVTITHTVDCPKSEDWTLGSLNLTDNGDLAKISKAFVMEPSELSGATLAIASGTTQTPTEGKVAFGLLQPDGTISYSYTANGGFFCKADGSVGSYGDGDPVFVEYDKAKFVLSYGQYPGKPEAGKKYTVKPVLVYTKDGKQYVATIVLNMQF
jgi:hypothetical protein